MKEAWVRTGEGIKTLEQGGTTWLDVLNPTAEIFAHLQKEYQLDPVHLHESLQKIQHTEVDHEKGYLFLVLRVPVQLPRHGKIGVRQVGVFLGKNYLVTIHEGENALITDLFDTLRLSPEKRTECFQQGSGQLVYLLVSSLLQMISKLTENVVAELDAIEDQVFDNTRSDAQMIGQVRHRIVKLRGIIGPKRLVLEDLEEQAGSLVGRGVTKYYATNTKTVNRLWEIIEEAQDTVEIYKDADFTTSTEQTNKTLAILTLIFTFTIPVTVFGTMYGMNIPLPGGLETGAWSFWGRYTTLAVVLTISTLAALGMYLWFKRKRWL